MTPTTAILATFAILFGFSACSAPLPGLSDRPMTSDFKPYPLGDCLVTGEGLDSKGGAITRYYQGRELKVCCNPCLNTFKSSPEVFMARLK